jgi:hypothetical protein
MRIIDADKLPEHKFTRESAKGSDYMRGWNDAIDAIVDNEPTVKPQKIVTIPPELIEKLASNVVDVVGNIDWEKAIEAYKARPTGEWIEEIIEELESRMDYGQEYAQAMEDVIVILKAKFGIDMEAENE